jgi:hypothetical protein
MGAEGFAVVGGIFRSVSLASPELKGGMSPHLGLFSVTSYLVVRLFWNGVLFTMAMTTEENR